MSYGGSTNGRAKYENSRDRDRDSTYNNSSSNSYRPDRPTRPDRTDRIDRNDRNDRNSDRSYISRYPNSQPRHSLLLAGYIDSQSGLNYRRQESRDYDGHKGGYNRSEGSDRNHGGSASAGGSINTKRRDRPQYLGSKYRTGPGVPKGPSQGRNPSQKIEPAPFNHVGGNSAKPDSRLESSSKDLVEHRRAQNRKQDWDSSMSSRATKALQNKLQDPRHPPASHNKVLSPPKYPKADTKYPKDVLDMKEPQGGREHVIIDQSKLSGQKQLLRENILPSPKHVTNETDSALEQKPANESKLPLKVETHSPGRETSSLAQAKVSASGRNFQLDPSSPIPPRVSENSLALELLASSKNEESSKMDIDGAPTSKNTPAAKDKVSDKSETQKADIPGSSSPNLGDTSVLSPVGSTASDDAFVQTLNIIPEAHGGVIALEGQENASEAETIVEDEELDMTVLRQFLRKKGRDIRRERIKRRNLVFSDEDDDSEEDLAEASRKASRSNKPNGKRAILGDESEGEQTSAITLEDEFSRPGKNTKSSTKRSRTSIGEEKAKLEKLDSKPSYKIKRDSTGRSQLQRACKKGDLQEVKNHINRGASANESDFGGFTCLHEAALAGHTEIIEYLIEKGADVNKQALEAGDFETPLMDAAENKHVGAVKMLLKHGADPHLCNNEGYSTITKLFHLQEEDGEYEKVIKVINDFAPPQVDSELSKVTHMPRKIIEDPSEKYFSDLVKKKSLSLIYRYAAQGNKESAAEDFVTNGFSLLKMPDVLNLAARNGHVELVDILLGLNPGKFDINQMNKIGVTVLLASVGRGYYDVVKFLLSRGADSLIKRVKDGMSALEIAKHSAQYDPREVVILEKSMNKAVKWEKPGLKASSAEPQDQNEYLEQGKLSKPAKKTGADRKASLSEEHENKSMADSSKNPKAVELKTPKRADPSDPEHSPLSEDDEPIRRMSPKRKMSSDELHKSKKAKRESSSEALDESTKASAPPNGESSMASHQNTDARSSLPIENLSLLGLAHESSPSGLSAKAQEEQKARAAEQAKIWQEKMQAKKKARKEMFLLAEKEKEKRRREDEQKRLELLKKQEAEEKERKQRAELEAKKQAEETERRMQVMEHQCILQKYPIGLQEAVFDGVFRKHHGLRYMPLYVFSFEKNDWVIDLQVALILAVPVPEIHSGMENMLGPNIDDASKDKLWSLFFKMIGVGKHNAIDANGMEKFRCLQLRYVKFDAVSSWVKLRSAEAHKVLWGDNRITRVDLVSLEAAQGSDPKQGSNALASGADVGFIPPKWRHRGDVLRTIRTANSPLW